MRSARSSVKSSVIDEIYKIMLSAISKILKKPSCRPVLSLPTTLSANIRDSRHFIFSFKKFRTAFDVACFRAKRAKQKHTVTIFARRGVLNLYDRYMNEFLLILNCVLTTCAQVQESHKEKTRTMEDAIKTAKEIHQESVVKDQEL